MKMPALITSLVLSATMFGSIAAAQSPYDRRNNDRERPYDRYDRDRTYDRYHRYDRWNRGDSEWTPLVTMSVGPRQRVRLQDPSERGFSRLRLEAVRGQPRIDAIYVRFRNGENQRVDVQRTLYEGQSIDVDLLGGRRNISSMVLIGPPDRWSRVTVIGIR